jgi:hypothetical protein
VKANQNELAVLANALEVIRRGVLTVNGEQLMQAAEAVHQFSELIKATAAAAQEEAFENPSS